MKFIKSSTHEKIVEEKVARDNLTPIGSFHFLERVMPLLFGATTIVTVVLAFLTVGENPDIVTVEGGKGENTARVLLHFLALFLVELVVHEVVHALLAHVFAKRGAPLYIVVGKGSLTVFDDSYFTRREALTMTLMPFAVIAFGCTVLSLVTGSIYYLIWRNYINLLLSTYDILTAVCIAKTVPRGAMIYGNYYKI